MALSDPSPTAQVGGSQVAWTEGLLSTPAPARRLHALPSVMTSPPTITNSAANAASSITSAVLVHCTSLASGSRPSSILTAATAGPYRYYGSKTGYGASGAQSNTYMAPAQVVSGGGNRGAWFVEFDYHGQKFEIVTRGMAESYYRLWVDDQPTVADSSLAASLANDGNNYLIGVDFGSVAHRRIRLEMNRHFRFGGVNIGPNDTIYPPSANPPETQPWVTLGDSFTQGTGAGPTNLAVTFQGWCHWMARHLGVKHMVDSGVGGTGYLTANGIATFRDRVAADVIAFNPSVVVVAGGYNDQPTFTAAAIGAEAATLFDTIKAGLPSAVLIVMAPWSPFGAPGTSITDTRDAIKTAAQGHGADMFIDPLAGNWWHKSGVTRPATLGGWISGTGRVGATAATGNSSVFTASDSTHPTLDGHKHYGRRFAEAILDSPLMAY
jgi:lysophospholipase L1-like esterase